MRDGMGLFIFLVLMFISQPNPYAEADLTMTFLHTNDVHARIEQMDKYGATCTEQHAEAGECYGGVARRYTKVEEIREAEEHVVLLDGGDQFQGTSWFYYYGGMEAAHFMNIIKYDVMGLGNHEFDNGVTGLVPFLENVTFAVLSCNIDSSNEPLLDGLYSPSTELMFGGVRVGFVGYTTKETEYLVHPGGIENLVFLDEITEIQKEVDNLIAGGINVIVAVGHAGFDMDVSIATNVTGVDVVVGGHTDTFLYTGDPPDIEEPEGDYPHVVTQSTGRKVLVVQDYTFAKYLGRLDVTFDDAGEVKEWSGNPILLDNSTAQDPDVLAEVERWRGPLLNFTKEEVGVSYVFLDGNNKICRTQECNIGNLICDAILYQHLRRPEADDTWTFVSAAFWNGGGIRSSINMGPVTLEDILRVLPFSNTVVLIKIRGHHLVEVLEHSVTAMPDSGRFLQYSGISVEYDLSQPLHQRVQKVFIRCADCAYPEFETLKDDQLYSVLTSEFLLSGGDDYTMLEEYAEEVHLYGTLDTDCLADFFKHHSPIVTGKTRRIVYSLTDPQQSSTGVAHFASVTSSLWLCLLLIKMAIVIKS